MTKIHKVREVDCCSCFLLSLDNSSLGLDSLLSPSMWVLQFVTLFVRCISGFWFLRSIWNWYRLMNQVIMGMCQHDLSRRCDPCLLWACSRSVSGVPEFASTRVEPGRCRLSQGNALHRRNLICFQFQTSLSNHLELILVIGRDLVDVAAC